ncbi:MAG: hypothetical protein KatS3mg032_1220 [Cyclobacteriaceae bacterium]|nr:MAG: hypothetical protein KatS3mg032_1220 [Cyclobacteriaceae bacterium]
MKKSTKKSKTPGLQVEEPALAYNRRVAGMPEVHQILGIAADDLMNGISRVGIFRRGLTKAAFNNLKETTGLDTETLARALAISSKTIQRTEVFDAVQSERMYLLADLYADGINYFGLEDFRNWMNRPLFTLGSIRPVELLDTTEGIRLIKSEIHRVQHGIAV